MALLLLLMLKACTRQLTMWRLHPADNTPGKQQHSTVDDEVPAELFKAGDGHGTGQNAQNMCGDLGNWFEWPEEWTFSTFIPLPKKGDHKQCANYRTIAPVSTQCLYTVWPFPMQKYFFSIFRIKYMEAIL